MVGDATAIYRRDTGLQRFIRRLCFLKPDVPIVVDDIAVDRPRRLELRFHPEYPCERQDGAWIAIGKKAVLRLETLTPDGVEVTAGETMGKDHDGKPMPLHAVRLETTAAWKHAVALSWSAAGSRPARVTLRREGDRWTFRAGDRSVAADGRDG